MPCHGIPGQATKRLACFSLALGCSYHFPVYVWLCCCAGGHHRVITMVPSNSKCAVQALDEVYACIRQHTLLFCGTLGTGQLKNVVLCKHWFHFITPAQYRVLKFTVFFQ